MSKRMTLEQDLSGIWECMASNGQIRNRFKDLNGEQLEAGIRMTEEGPRHYAINVETNEERGWRVVERPLESSDFILQWNPYRALKPQGNVIGLARRPAYSPDAADCLFGCQDSSDPLSLLQRHAPIQTTLCNFQWAALANALPVESRGHFLWIPVLTVGIVTSYPHWLQVLTLPLLHDFLSLGTCSFNLITYFNSLHAGASVNHIHFQSVYCDTQPAIAKAAVNSTGGRNLLVDYPACALVYEQGTPAEAIWRDVTQLQQRNVPLNLITVERRTFLFARNMAHARVDEFPDAILAGMELSGKAITSRRDFFQQADRMTIETALRKSTLTSEELLQVLAS